MKKYIIILAVLLFIMGIVFITNDELKAYNEPFVSGQCPTTMIKNGEQIMVYNPKMAKIPGVNPILLDNLEDYKEYVRWQKQNKLDCPILYLEKVFDTQGQEMYEIKPSFDTDIPIGAMNHSMPRVTHEPKILDASRDDPPYNQNSLPGIDNQNQMVGYGIGSDKMILYPNSQNIEPANYLRRK
jgi:hypothetical protein